MNSMIAIVITDSGVAHRHSTRVKELSSLHLKLCRVIPRSLAVFFGNAYTYRSWRPNMALCPLLKTECLGEGCAWWEPVDKKCAVLLLAYTTDIEGFLEKKLDKLF